MKVDGKGRGEGGDNELEALSGPADPCMPGRQAVLRTLDFS